jgi:hypothetical protein
LPLKVSNKALISEECSAGITGATIGIALDARGGITTSLGGEKVFRTAGTNGLPK